MRLYEEQREEQEEVDGSLLPGSKRPRLLLNAVREVVGAQSIQRHLYKIEPFLRRVVQDEVQTAVCRYTRSFTSNPVNQIQGAVTRCYRLHFQNRMPQTLFTGSKIEAEGKMPIQIVMMDDNLHQRITCGPLSSIKIEIVVLDGDFGGDEQGKWTEDEFSDSIQREREGKRPLLTGELVITLSSGIGVLGEVTFTDNSSWIRSRKFRLGARVYQGECAEGRVQEAISEAFLVKDHRGELYKKHHPPSLNDEVWRLEKIGKEGAFHKRLKDSGITTVQDFLKAWVIDQDRLRTLLGNGMSNKIWEATVEHAKECVLGNKFYAHFNVQGMVPVFDSIFQLVGAIFDNIFHPLHDLTAAQKVVVEKLKQLAYENVNEITELDEALCESFVKPLLQTDVPSSTGSFLADPQILDIHATRHAADIQVGFLPQIDAPYNDPVDNPSPLKDINAVHNFHPLERFASVHTNSFNKRDSFDVGFGGFQSDLLTADFMGHTLMEEHVQGYNSKGSITSSNTLPTVWGYGNELAQVISPHDPHSCLFPRLPRAPSKWVKVTAVLKWMSILTANRAKIAGLDDATWRYLCLLMHKKENGDI